MDCNNPSTVITDRQTPVGCIPQTIGSSPLTPIEDPVNQEDRDNLLSAKFDLGNPLCLQSWGLAASDMPCGSPRWQYLGCDMHGRVTGVFLVGQGFNVTLPTALGQLSSLKVLNIFGNAFTGTLPDVWSALTGLEELDLHDNLLVGTLPASWSSMGSLRSLDMSQNIFQVRRVSWAGSFPSVNRNVVCSSRHN